VGGLSHYLEREGLATTQISLIKEHTETIKPPRALWVSFELGRPFGKPNDPDFQHRVLSAVLDLLNEKEGPILIEYTEEAAYTESEGPWACPIDLSWAAEDLSEEGRLIKAFKSEMSQLRNWYDIAVAKRDRTTVGVSGVDVDNLADFISSFLSITARKAAGVFHRAAFHVTQNCSLFVHMFKRRHHIRIELGTGSFVDNLKDKFFFHSFAVGTIRCHGIVNISHRKNPSQKGDLLTL
jgi:hypothetical protein